MTVRVGKIFEFSAAHHLPYHDGKCKRLHGHNYKVEVVFEGLIHALSKSEPRSGMVIDFGTIGQFWKEFIEPDLDHQNLNESLDIYPTAEVLGRYIFYRFHGLFSDKIVSVKVWETDTCWAKVTD